SVIHAWFLRRRRALVNRPPKPASRAWGFRPRLETLESRTLLSAGDLDPTFGQGGKVLTAFEGSQQDEATAVARQADGKLVVAGTSRADINHPPRLALARYNPDGSLDASFDGDGRVIIDLAGLGATNLTAP